MCDSTRFAWFSNYMDRKKVIFWYFYVQMWSFSTEQPIFSSPAISQDINIKPTIFFGSHDGFTYCVDTKTGNQIWKYRPEGSSAPVYATPCPFQATWFTEEDVQVVNLCVYSFLFE